MSSHVLSPYQQFIQTSRYAKWREDLWRRETHTETIDRYVDFIVGHLGEQGYVPPAKTVAKVRSFMKEQKALGSMRALMTAGPALERNNVAGYNCCFIPMDSPRSFDELLYILMNGTGVGFSVERRYVEALPVISETFESSTTVIRVGDSKEGWAKSLRELLALLWAGQVPEWDTSEVRPAGAKLKTFGGRASGPGPLEDLFAFAVDIFRRAHGRRLSTLEAFDLVCKIADVVVVGGVRRSALICLSDLDDQRLATAKSGDWYEKNPHRRLANISAVYERSPEIGEFMQEWLHLYESKSGERGIFNRAAVRAKVASHGRRDPGHAFGTNPCGEIFLRPYQFCNLSTVIVREEDTLETLAEKVEVAAILGTWQSTLTNFKYLRKIWRANTEEERLLGVSMTGQLGHPLLNGTGEGGLEAVASRLDVLREIAVGTNQREAQRLGIPASAAVTCVKPEGTVSQYVNASSGMHPWHNEHYLRTVRATKTDPLSQFMVKQGFPHEEDLHNPTDWVFSFPIKAPKGALTRNDLTAEQHLEIWLTYKKHWAEHNPSVTINVREPEWLKVGAWVFEHFDEVTGVAFLPHSEHIYKQAPYQDITAEEYATALAAMPEDIDWVDLALYENEDHTTGTQELSCTASGGGCEVVDLV